MAALSCCCTVVLFLHPWWTRLNKTPTWCNKMQILLLQTFSTMFRASCAHRQECKILTRQPPVQVVTVVGGSSLCHIRDETVSFVPNMAKWWPTYNRNYLYRWLPCQYFTLLTMGAWRPKHVEKVCSNKICILLHHVGVLFNLTLWCTETQN